MLAGSADRSPTSSSKPSRAPISILFFVCPILLAGVCCSVGISVNAIGPFSFRFNVRPIRAKCPKLGSILRVSEDLLQHESHHIVSRSGYSIG
jgi:hypothetical protein